MRNASFYRLTILSVVRMTSINPVYIKQQLLTMNHETRVVIIHTTSYVDFFLFYICQISL